MMSVSNVDDPEPGIPDAAQEFDVRRSYLANYRLKRALPPHRPFTVLVSAGLIARKRNS